MNTRKLEEAGRLYAQGVYPIMSRQQLSCLSIGMTDMEIKEMGDKYVKDVLLRDAEQKYEIPMETLETCIDKQGLAEAQDAFGQGLVLGLMALHKGKMIA